MSDPQELITVIPADGQTDPLAFYQDFVHEIPDPVADIHTEFVQTMPRLDGQARIKAAEWFYEKTNGKTPEDFTESFVHDNPFVVRRILEFQYGEEELTAKEVILRGIAEAPGVAEEEAGLFEETMLDVFQESDDPESTLESTYENELDSILYGPLIRVLKRSDSTVPAGDYIANPIRMYKTIVREPVIIGDTVVREPIDIYKLNMPEFRQPWEAPVEAVIAALETGAHVVIGARRNSGKTHIFPSVLRERAPQAWEISEVTNNILNGGEGFGSSAAGTLFRGIYDGTQIDDLIDQEHTLRKDGAHVRKAVGNTPERKILVVDEIQEIVLDEKYREAQVLRNLVAWADENNTQLVMISAIGDQRQVPEVSDYINAIIPDYQQVKIEAFFDRPDYPRDVLTKLLGQVGVGAEVIEWIAEQPAAKPLRSMRGLSYLYGALSDVYFYQHINDYRVRNLGQLASMLDAMNNKSFLGSAPLRLFDVMAVSHIGSGSETVALAKSLGLPEPNFYYLGHRENITPEDLL
ncbi:MAG: hypothetical protein JWO47_780 [Candidatus Saccharibacteria bacterium]|nr:hypothetical protein [Candidatus Saccharibacteria bacterium]